MGHKKRRGKDQEASKSEDNSLNSNQKDKSPYLYQKPKIKTELHIRDSYRWTEKQKKFIELANDKSTKAIFLDALWGTGKSLLAFYCALHRLNQKKCDEIVFIRNTVESSKLGAIGLLPGSPLDKVSPFMDFGKQKLDELLPKNEVDFLLNDERVTFHHVGFERGKNYACKTLIIEEAGCLTKEDLFLLLSRVAEHTMVFIIGDSLQSDIPKSGFVEVFNLFNDAESREQGIHCLEWKEESDVMRSGFLRFVMKKIIYLKNQEKSKDSGKDWYPSPKK